MTEPPSKIIKYGPDMCRPTRVGILDTEPRLNLAKLIWAGGEGDAIL